MELLVVMPITKECNMYLREKGFAFRWLDFPDTQWEIKTSNGQLIDELQKHHQEASIYQREPFTAGSPTHQWLWYYEEAIPSQIRIVTSRSAKVFVHRESLNLLPQHYGKGPMQGYINEQLNKLQHEYLVFSNISLFIGTWNCAGTCPSKNIIDWFNRTTEEYDIIVINLQEVCELTTMNILANENGQDVWLHFLINQVRIAFPSTQYEIVSFI